MDVYVLDANYDKIGYIDEAESVLWIKRYYDYGECEIYIPSSPELRSLLKSGNYLYRLDDDMLCEIKKVKKVTNTENGSYLTVTGYDVSRMLSDRIVRWEVIFSGKPYDFLKQIIEENVINPQQPLRLYENITFKCDIEDDTVINVNAFTENLLELIKTTCKTYSYGFKIAFDLDTKSFQIIIYKGKDKSRLDASEYVEFSPLYANITSSQYEEDSTNFKNVCYVGYTEEEVTKLYSVFIGDSEPSGSNRKEIYVDGTNIKREISQDELDIMFPNNSSNGSVYYDSSGNEIGVLYNDAIHLTENAYYYLIRTLGYNTLAEHNDKKSFIGVVDATDTYMLIVDYDLGDIVKVIDDDGIEGNARITEITESDEEGYSIEPTYEYIE